MPRLKQLSRRQTRLKKQTELTKELLALIGKRRLMYYSHFLQGDENEKTYRKFSNKLTKSITLGKKQHFATLLETKKLNPKATREIMGTEFPTATVQSSAAKDFIDKNELLDQKAAADLLTIFFIQ